MNINNLSSKCVKIWKIRLTLLLVCWWFVCGAVAAFSFLIAGILAVLSIAVYLFEMLCFLDLMYKHYTYTVGKSGVTIRKGILIKKKIYIDRSRLQYSEMLQTPLQRLFKTCTIVYQAAGAVVYLSQIDTEKANGVMFK